MNFLKIGVYSSFAIGIVFVGTYLSDGSRDLPMMLISTLLVTVVVLLSFRGQHEKLLDKIEIVIRESPIRDKQSKWLLLTRGFVSGVLSQLVGLLVGYIGIKISGIWFENLGFELLLAILLVSAWISLIKLPWVIVYFSLK